MRLVDCLLLIFRDPELRENKALDGDVPDLTLQIATCNRVSRPRYGLLIRLSLSDEQSQCNTDPALLLPKRIEGP